MEASNTRRPGLTANPVKKPKKKKMLLMGKSGSGKSSMRSIIFSNYDAKDTRRLGATIDVDLSHVKFMGNLTLNLWDCGGQEAFMENYLTQQQAHIFSNVGVMIYVFDVDSHETERDLATYQNIIGALHQYSPTATLFVLVHKMDLVRHDLREALFLEKLQQIQQKTQEVAASSALRNTSRSVDSSADAKKGQVPEINFTVYPTSIWDQSVYKAWASIIHDLVPNLAILEDHLERLGRHIDAEEVLLFERTSFLVVSHWSAPESHNNPFHDRFERMSNVMKSFKQSISRYNGSPCSSEQFKLFELKLPTFCLFVVKFTVNTYLWVVLPPGEERFNMALLNVQIASDSFAELDTPIVAASASQPQASRY